MRRDHVAAQLDTPVRTEEREVVSWAEHEASGEAERPRVEPPDVWLAGIMDSFRSIGAKGAANLSTVAPGIAEALVTTAIGLIAAVPAVMAFNYFARRVKVLSAEMESFSNDFLNIVKRHFLR